MIGTINIVCIGRYNTFEHYYFQTKSLFYVNCISYLNESSNDLFKFEKHVQIRSFRIILYQRNSPWDEYM